MQFGFSPRRSSHFASSLPPKRRRLRSKTESHKRKTPLRLSRGWRAFEQLEHRVLLSATPTSIALIASANSVVDGQGINLAANVSASPAAPSQGSVSFFDNGVLLGSESVTSGSATLDNVKLPLGSYAITASYSDSSGGFASSSTTVGPNSTIATVAGNGGYGSFGFSGDGGAASAAKLNAPSGVAIDSAGDLFIADTYNNRIREVHHATGIITTVAGNGTKGYSGNGAAATAAELNAPSGVTVDSAGDLLIADTGNNVIRGVNLATGLITTVAGTGTENYGGDGGPATAAELAGPSGIAFDSAGDLFIADTYNNRIREVDHTTGVITTVAGNGATGFSGDGGDATAAEISIPGGVAIDSAGELFIRDDGNNRIREVDLATGVITTVAGDATAGYSGNGGAATAAELNGPAGVAVDSAGDLFIADTRNNVIREVDHATGIITTVAGNGTDGYGGDGGAATAAELNAPAGIAIDSAGDLFIADNQNSNIRAVDHATNIITTVAGDHAARPFYTGDGGPATAAQLNGPDEVAIDAAGDLFVADAGNNVIRKVNHATGIITTVAGNGMPTDPKSPPPANSGDGGAATNAELFEPYGLAVDSAGDLFIGEADGIIQKVDHATGIINIVAGTGTEGYSGDGGPATAAELGSYPYGLVVDSAGDLFIADEANVVRKVDHATGIITTMAGNGIEGYGGDGGPATAAELDTPEGLAVDSTGDLFIADDVNNLIREVNHATGVITTVAGNGVWGESGDRGPATKAELEWPEGIAFDSVDDLFIDDGDGVIREVDHATGVITTVAGNGTEGDSGNGGPAIAAELNGSFGIAVDAAGNLFIADTGNNVIREVASGAMIVNVTSIPPSFNVGRSQTVLENAGPQTATAWATNISAGSSSGTLAFVLASDSNPALFSTVPAVNVTTGNLSYTPAANATGTATIKLVLEANGGTANGGQDSRPQSFTITVTAFSGSHNQAYVTAVYEDVLGRAPDSGGLAYWSQQLDLGTPVSDVAQSIVTSAEYYAKFVIEPDYLKLLGRPADDAGVQYWTTQMQNGLTDQGLEADLVAADEFYNNAGGTDVKWIDTIYQLLLGRPADSSGESYWTGQLASGETRSQVAIGIAGSTENNTQLINDDYFHYLGRAADAGGLAYWLSQFANGSTNEDVIAGFTGAAEYYNKHTS